jgi:hypothetical protein
MRGTSSRVTGASALVAVVAMLVAAGLAGCSGGSDKPAPSSAPTSVADTGGTSTGAPGPTTSAGAASPTPVPYASLAASPPAAIGSVDGRPEHVDQTIRLEVLAVQAKQDTTVLQFRISTQVPMKNVYPGILHQDYGSPDVGGVSLVAKQAGVRLQVSYAGLMCLCSWVPLSLGPEGAYLSAVFPPLPATVTQVEVAAPGFPAVPVPVTRG